MAGNQKKYKAFFCYRRYNDGDEHADRRLAASVNTAAYIFGHWENLKRDLPGGEKLGDALFEEQCSSVCYAELDNIFESVEYFFVFICPGFFDRIIADFAKHGNSYEKLKEYYTAEEDNIPYLEINKALDSPKCTICPVYIDYNGDENCNKYLEEHKAELSEVFGNKERWNNLLKMTNNPHFVYLDSDPHYDRLSCAYHDNLIGFFGAVESSKENETLFKSIKECWGDVRGIQRKFVTARSEKNSAITLDMKKSETDWNAYTRFKDIASDIYYIPGGYINGVKSEYIREHSSSVYIGKGFNSIKERCGLFIGESDGEYDPYVYYPIDWCQSNDSSKRTDISICAICFGALMLKHYRDIDRANFTKYDLSVKYPMSDGEIQKKINGAMNLLLTLRDYEKFCWMSGWNFENGTSGTINQTTLSISTLLACGFLKDNFATPDGEEREKERYNRYLYIKDSMHWLGNQRHDSMKSDDDACYWVSGKDNTENATLTVFCFEIFMKYARTLTEFIEDNSSAPEEYIDEWSEELDYARETLEGALEFLCSKYGTVPRGGENEEKQEFCDRAMVLRAVTQYYIYHHTIYGKNSESKEDDPLMTEARNLIRNNTTYLYTRPDDYILDCEPKEPLAVIPIIKGEENGMTEQYEHCGHLICIDTLVKIASTVDDCKIVDLSPVDMRKKAVRLLLEYRDADKNKSDRIAGVGKGDARHYPIYSAYYYRMAVSDCEKYFGDDTKK